jgi:hypothetical protein
MPQPGAHSFDAFLSYASADRSRVARIQRFLERSLRSAGDKTASVYMDQTDIRGGKLADELGQALLQSRALIVCCSPASKQSTWVNTEVEKFMAGAPDRPLIPLLLDGSPETAFPASLPANLRYHDLRAGSWLGVLSPSARDELLRVTALLSGAELRELINWDRRRLMLRGAAAVAAGVPLAGTGWWLFDRATRVRPADVSARVAYQWTIGELADGARLHDMLSRDPKLTLRAATQPGAMPSPWPKRKIGVLAMPELVLTANEGPKQLTERRTVDDASYVSTRSFPSLSGALGAFDRRSVWTGATFEAIVQVMDPESRRSTFELLDDRFTREATRKSFDELYGIAPADRDGWGDEDYSVTPLPIRATFELFVNNAPVWSAEGMAAQVSEHDEDVRGLQVVYFRAARGAGA